MNIVNQPCEIIAEKLLHLLMSSSQQQSLAHKRLLKDLLELEKNPLPGICALPLENNIFEWHCNLLGTPGTPYNGHVFHLVLKFPNNYPDSPPKAELLTSVHHSHVYSNWICLDMLQTHYSLVF